MTPEAEIAILKFEIDHIRKTNIVPGKDGTEPRRLYSISQINDAIKFRCRRILAIEGKDYAEIPGDVIGLLRAVGYSIDGLPN